MKWKFKLWFIMQLSLTPVLMCFLLIVIYFIVQYRWSPWCRLSVSVSASPWTWEEGRQSSVGPSLASSSWWGNCVNSMEQMFLLLFSIFAEKIPGKVMKYSNWVLLIFFSIHNLSVLNGRLNCCNFCNL